MAGQDSEELLSIGELARAVGLSPDTLRVWERRYGRPVPLRLPSGHRRYPSSDVPWLRRVTEALARGHRPGEVVPAKAAELDALLARDGAQDRVGAFADVLTPLRGFDALEVRALLEAHALDLGPAAFLSECVAPLLVAVGSSWADGELSVRHEHLVTEVLQDVLRGLRVDHPAPDDGPVILLATLEGEDHGVGLLMAGLRAQLAGWRVHSLGTNVPLEELVAIAGENQPRAVGISVSLATGGPATDRLLRDLRGALPEDVDLLVGGTGARGARRGPRGVEYATTFEELDAWLGERG